MHLKKVFVTASLFVSASALFAATTASLLPAGEGTYLQWTPKSGTTHSAMVDEISCNGATDYVSTTVTGKRDSYTVSLSSIPDGSTITAVTVTPCASKNKSSGSSVMNVFYRLNGTNSADQGAYSLTGTTPSALSGATYSGLSIVKNASTSLEVGAVLTSGTAGVRLSRIATVVTYTPAAPNAPSNLMANVFGTSTTVSLSWTDNSSNELGFWVERGTDGINFNFLATTTFAFYNNAPGSGTFYYRVKAFNEGGNSSFSNTASTTLP